MRCGVMSSNSTRRRPPGVHLGNPPLRGQALYLDSPQWVRAAPEWSMTLASFSATSRLCNLSRAEPRPLPGATPDADHVAALIHILEDLEGSADNAVLRALRSIVRVARINGAERSLPMAELELTLQLRTDTGSLLVAPLRTRVLNRAVGGVPGGDMRQAGFKQRNQRVLQPLLLEAAPEDERRDLWELEGFTGRSYTRRMMEVLTPLLGVLIASALIDCPILDVRRAALRPYLDHDLPVSRAFNEELEREVQAIYRPKGFSWTWGWCPGGMARERQVLAFIHRYADDPNIGLPLRDIVSGLQINETSLYRMLHEGAAP